MTSKTQLQTKIKELETELQSFKQQLNTYKPVIIQEASVGDTLEDGSVVLSKENGLALLIAPKSTEIKATWTQEFTEVFNKLQEQGFNPSQWFVPTKRQLQLAYERLKNEFNSTYYWSSAEFSAYNAWAVFFFNGAVRYNRKADTSFVRAFRCVTY